MNNYSKLLKPVFYTSILATLWLGPNNIFNTNIQEEKLHITTSLLIILAIITYRIPHKKPAFTDVSNLSSNKKIQILKKQLRHQWQLAREVAPFRVKHNQVKIIVASNNSGSSSLAANLRPISVTELPFKIEWYHDSNSLILVISPTLYQNSKAQHDRNLFEQFFTFLSKNITPSPIAAIYLLIEINKTMQTSIDMSIDAYNYVISTINHKYDQIPLNVVFTKCDEIAGFVPFFEHQDQEIKKQPWAIDFDDFDEFEFNCQFNKIIENINDDMVNRLHIEAQLHRRVLIKEFPIQLEKLRSLILNHLNHLIHSSKLPISRLAFASATQKGNYIDLIEKNIDLNTENKHHQLKMINQRYFCDHLFASTQKKVLKTEALLSQNWAQLLLVISAFVGIKICSNVWWLQRFNDIVNYQTQNLYTPKLVLEQNAALWRQWQLSYNINLWLKQNPMPSFIPHSNWHDNMQKIEQKLIASVEKTIGPTCNNHYNCLIRSWQPFASANEINYRLIWVKNHKQQLHKLNLQEATFEQASIDLVSQYINKGIPSNISTLSWLEALLEMLNDKNAPNELKTPESINKVQQLVAILKIGNDGAKAVEFIKNNTLSTTQLPEQLEKIASNVYKDLNQVLVNHINIVWQKTVLNYYNEHAKDKYPFNKKSESDLALKDLKKLFKMKNFFIDYYINPVQNLGIKLKPETLSDFNAMEQFVNHELPFNIRAIDISKNIRVAELYLAGNLSNLSIDKTNKFHWPLAGDDDSIGIWLQDKDGRMAMISRHGPWSLFKLLEATGTIQQGQQEATLQLAIGDKNVKILLHFERPWSQISQPLPQKLL